METEPYTSVVVVLSAGSCWSQRDSGRSSSSGGGRTRYRHAGGGGAKETHVVRVREPHRALVAAGVVTGAASASGARLPPARHPIRRRDPGPDPMREVPEREVGEA
jgi:hypothetical protein